MIEIANHVDWNVIRAEYIAGGISQRKIAKKYGVSEAGLMQKANKENWKRLRDDAERKGIARTQQKTANAVASNAVKLERAKGLAIDRIIKALESMPETSATNMRQYVQKDGKRQTIEYNLLELVTALEKMQKSEDGNLNNDSVKIIIDV